MDGKVQPSYVVCEEKKEDLLEESHRWAEAYGIPIIMFEQIERAKERDIRKDIDMPNSKRRVSPLVLEIRNILDDLEKKKKDLQEKESDQER